MFTGVKIRPKACLITSIVPTLANAILARPFLASPFGAALGPPGLHTTTRDLQTCTFQGPGLQTPPKFHERTPRKLGREMEKKWDPPPLQAPHFSGFGQHLPHPHLAKCGLANFGLAKCGRDRVITPATRG